MAATRKPTVIVPIFQDENPLVGLANFGKQMLNEKFKVVLERDLQSDKSLYEKIEGLLLMPGIPTELLKTQTLDQFTNLKVVSSVSAGFNHLPIDYLKSRSIRVGITPGVLNDATAEMAILLLMACARDLRAGLDLAMGDQAVTSFGSNIYKQEVTGSTLGIVGMGGIGYEIAQRANGLKMDVMYHNRNKRNDDGAVNATYCDSLHSMLPLCDFIAISCPLDSNTKHLFSTKEFQLMKKSARIINVARGPVIDSMALVEALNTGTIAGAGLDVTDPEPLPRDHPLLTCPNITITPHWGSATLKTRQAMFQRAADNLAAVLIGNGDMLSELKL